MTERSRIDAELDGVRLSPDGARLILLLCDGAGQKVCGGCKRCADSDQIFQTEGFPTFFYRILAAGRIAFATPVHTVAGRRVGAGDGRWSPWRREGNGPAGGGGVASWPRQLPATRARTGRLTRPEFDARCGD